MKDEVVFRTIDAPGLDAAAEFKKKFGIDLENNPDYEIVTEGATDNFGISDSIYSEVMVVRKNKRTQTRNS